MRATPGARATTVACAISGALLAAGCGSDATKTSTTNANANTTTPVSVTVTSPTSGSVVGSENVTVRGTVTPSTARVEINGHAVAAGSGSFAGVANLHSGQNTLDIIASASGQAPSTTTLVLIRQASGPGSSSEARQGPTTTASRPTTPSSEQKPSPTVTATGSWPAATSAWTVVLASVGSRGEAEEQQQRASSASLPETGVLLSAVHQSLRSGYWVAFTGVLSHEDAVKRQQQARTSGFTDAYARYVSAE